MNIIDQLGGERFNQDTLNLSKSKRVFLEDRFLYGFDVLRVLNNIQNNLRHLNIDSSTYFIDEEGEVLSNTRNIDMPNLKNIIESEYPIVLNVREQFTDFYVVVRTDFPVIYFDANQPLGVEDLSQKMRQSLHSILRELIPDECVYEFSDGDEEEYSDTICEEREERRRNLPKENLIKGDSEKEDWLNDEGIGSSDSDAYYFLAGSLVEHTDYSNTFFNDKYLAFPSWRKSIEYLKSPLFRNEIVVRSNWKSRRISDMQDNIGQIVQFLKSTDIFDDVGEECEEKISADLGYDVDCGNVYAFYDHFVDQTMTVLETLYYLNPNFSLYSPFKLNEFDLSENLKDVIKKDFETYANLLKSTKNP